MAISNSLAVTQGKGGVGKTTVVANLAGLFAAAGYRVLVGEFDPQGNLSRDFGYEKQSGEELLMALMSGGRPPVIKDVRHGLDVIPAGPALVDVAGMMLSRLSRGGETLGQILDKVLAPIVPDYDIVLFDTPPGDVIIGDAVLYCTSSVLIPTRADDGSLDGLDRVAERFARAREHNPQLRLAGMLLFAVGSRSQRLQDQVRESITQAIPDTIAPIFNTTIRYMESAAADARRHGLLAHELEGAAASAKKARLKALRDKVKPPSLLLSRDATGLADDYEALATEVLHRLAELADEANRTQEGGAA